MMTLAKRILVIFILLFPISNSFGSMVTEVQNVEECINGGQNRQLVYTFNPDGTKMFFFIREFKDGNFNFVEVNDFPHHLIFQQKLMQEIVRDVN